MLCVMSSVYSSLVYVICVMMILTTCQTHVRRIDLMSVTLMCLSVCLSVYHAVCDV